MADDEVFLVTITVLASFASFGVWRKNFGRRSRLFRVRSLMWPLKLTLLLCLGLIVCVLRVAADREVKDDAGYIILLTALGFVWLSILASIFPWLGLSIRDDSFERRNPAATIAICGALMSGALIYAGGNVGEGLSLWNNVFSAGIGTIAFILVWMVFDVVTQVSSSVAEGRDNASGIRLAGLLMSVGLVLGRAVAGTWESEASTAIDLVKDSWPVVILIAVAMCAEKRLRPTGINPFPAWTTHGLFPALSYLAVAFAYVFWLGKPK